MRLKLKRQIEVVQSVRMIGFTQNIPHYCYQVSHVADAGDPGPVWPELIEHIVTTLPAIKILIISWSWSVWSHNTALIADWTIKILKIIMLEQITAFCQSLCLCHQSFWYNLHSSPVITPVSTLHSWYTFTLHLRTILIAFIDQNKIFHWINRCCAAGHSWWLR